jgi:hypothetical protein
MDFTKFVSMLVHKGIFFSRLDKLNDPFEGSLPRLNTRDDLIRPPKELADNPKVAEAYMSGLKNIRKHIRELRPWIYASTWHMAEHESAGMWKLYSRTEEAICIRSTFSKLCSALPDDVYVGQVIYIDYEQQFLPIDNLLWPYMHKRRSFEHERELRALIPDLSSLSKSPRPEPPAAGVWRDTDLSSVIEHVHIAPTAPQWFKETVEATIKQFGFEFKVTRSILDESPMW